MAIRYGNDDCNHKWRYRTDGYEEGCIPAICIECGAFGCQCDITDPAPSKKTFFDEGQPEDANINGRWKNPYIKQAQATPCSS